MAIASDMILMRHPFDDRATGSGSVARGILLPEGLLRKALAGADWRSLGCAVCGMELLSEDVAIMQHCGLNDSRVSLEYPDEGEPFLVLTVPLDCSTCSEEYEVEVALHFNIDEVR